MKNIYQINRLEQRYGRRCVLSIDSLDIHRGEILALVGPSGAGKSTLLRLLAMLEAPTAGHLAINLRQSYTYHDIPIEAKRQIAMVFQRPALLSRSVWANVAYGLKLRGQRTCEVQVEDMLKRLSIDHLTDAKPRTLSGGEMQRVSIARAMILQPEVLILDEPTSNLDPHNIRIIEHFLQDQHAEQGTTIVIVTHNIFQAKRLADRVGLIYDGHLIEVTDTQTFFENPHDERTAAFTGGHLIY
ncbi:MAG: phosphate ABC transporter ATP-binding protein [Chloroflexota bacterium]